MTRQKFIEKWQPGHIDTTGTHKNAEWLNDFYNMLMNEEAYRKEGFLKIIDETFNKIK